MRYEVKKPVSANRKYEGFFTIVQDIIIYNPFMSKTISYNDIYIL